MKTRINFKNLILIKIALFFINLGIFSTKLQAQILDSQESESINSSLNFQQPKPPSDAPKTGRGQGGASRGQCFLANSKSEIKLTPLIPVNGWGLTVSESPTLWIYIAYSAGKLEGETPLLAELSVEDRELDRKIEPKIYSFELPKTSGIFSISLPHSLKLNQWYRWYLVINCQTENTNNVLQLEGFFQRTELSHLKDNLESLGPPELISLYIENQIWYDAFHQATLLQCNNWPNQQLRSYWQILLRSEDIKLDEISNQPLICNR